ncbi:hypothetical protein Barb6_00849 [Bacteroidales bacterium Barb6]|nr:hypothetical protein Barb6_00849 [Bacteroidales bacterium Barb6]
MDKKFFALFAGMLLAINISAHATGSPCLLVGKSGQGETVYLIVEGERLMARNIELLPQSYGEWQAALWEITVSQNDYITTPYYTFKHRLTGFQLALNHAEAVAVNGIAASPSANLLGGSIKQWIPHTKSTEYVAGGFFYVPYSDESGAVVTWGLENAGEPDKSKNRRIVPLAYKSYEALSAVVGKDMAGEPSPLSIEIIDWNDSRIVAKTVFPLTVNELNTKIGSSGDEYKDGRFLATKDSYFELEISPKETFLFSSLQAQSVVNGVKAEGGFSADVKEEPWVALYAANATGFIVTDETGSIRSEDKWKDHDSRYWFKFLYDIKTGRVSLVSYAGNYLTYQQTGGISTYKFTQESDVNRSFDSWITPIEGKDTKVYIPSNTYLLQVTGTNLLKDKYTGVGSKRLGKYVKLALDGTLEFVDWNPLLQQMPSAQWVIESSDTLLKVTNREFASFVPNDYLPAYARPYGKTGQSEAFYFLHGDTFKLTTVTSADNKHAGYKHFEQKELNVNRYYFNYLSETPALYIAMQRDSTLDITAGIYTEFSLEVALTNEYGYVVPFDASAVRLERSAYRLYSLEEGTKLYVSSDPETEGRKYYLQKNPEKASLFFLKELRREGVNSYYALADASFIPGYWVEIDAFGKKIRDYISGVTLSSIAGKNVVKAEEIDYDWKAKRYEGMGEIVNDPILRPFWKTGVVEAVECVGEDGKSFFYAKVANGSAYLSMLYANRQFMALASGELGNGFDYALFRIGIANVSAREVDANKPIVFAGKGKVVVKGVAGKKVLVSTVLGKTLAGGTLSSDEAEFAAPTGIVIVAVEGSPAVKVIVK